MKIVLRYRKQLVCFWLRASSNWLIGWSICHRNTTSIQSKNIFLYNSNLKFSSFYLSNKIIYLCITSSIAVNDIWQQHDSTRSNIYVLFQTPRRVNIHYLDSSNIFGRSPGKVQEWMKMRRWGENLLNCAQVFQNFIKLLHLQPY